MALQVCKKCTTRYAPAGQCPHCGANEWVSELEADEQLAVKDAAPAQPSAAPPAADDAPPDYATYPVVILRDLARERGITTHGAVKADLAAALAEWDAEQPGGDDTDDADAAGDVPDGG